MTVSISSKLVQLAAVAGAHGVRGHLKLKTFTSEPRNVVAYGPLLDEHGRVLLDAQIVSDWQHGVIVRARGISDRDTAAAMRGLGLFVPRDKLPEVDDDEFYHEDLIGLRAIEKDGRQFGVITAVHDFGAGDLLEIKGEDGEWMIPFTADSVPELDLSAGIARIERPVESSPVEIRQ